MRTPEELEKKLLNFAHHYEFEKSGLKIEDIRKYISEKRIIYDYKADQKLDKWKSEVYLQKVELKDLPSYINNNSDKFKDWID